MIKFLKTVLEVPLKVRLEMSQASASAWSRLTLRREFYARGALYSQIPFVIYILFWEYWLHLELRPFPIGFAIAALGLAAVIMTVRAEHGWSRREQAVWIALAFILFILESRTLFQDRDEQDERHTEETREQAAQFERVMRQNQAQFSATMKEESGVMRMTQSAANSARDAVEGLTGGDSYALIGPSIDLQNPRSGKFVLMLTVHGKYSIWDARIEGRDTTDAEFPNLGNSLFSYGSGSLSPTYSQPIGTQIKPDPSKINTYVFSVFSRQDPTTETMKMRHNQLGCWEVSTAVFRNVRSTRSHPPTKKQTDLLNEPWMKTQDCFMQR